MGSDPTFVHELNRSRGNGYSMPSAGSGPAFIRGLIPFNGRDRVRMSDLTPRLTDAAPPAACSWNCVRMSDLTPGLGPRPVAPTPPGPDDCCHSGCTWCVMDLY
ncbi:oxidoreductase-like domain-containing protein, partial [Pseudoduganella sp. RAF53_2]|uniref:oxidoreductase-like domain-containing protein n=1 Tax=Pseudoduganella sp. RAF53_2 TaxID=3233060 RepID=UPI003F949DCD